MFVFHGKTQAVRSHRRKQSSNSGIDLKKAKVAKNDNIRVNHFTSAKQIGNRPQFREKKSPESFSLRKMVNYYD